jgi:hypothetical protein
MQMMRLPAAFVPGSTRSRPLPYTCRNSPPAEQQHQMRTEKYDNAGCHTGHGINLRGAAADHCSFTCTTRELSALCRGIAVTSKPS